MANVRFGISPLFHVISGVARAEHSCVGVSVNRDRWWRQARRHVPAQAAPVFELVNASLRGVPAFVLATRGQQLGDELDAMLEISDATFYRDLSFYDQEPELPRIVAELREGGTSALPRFTDAVRALFRACLAPYWPDILRLLQAEIAGRARTSAEAGASTMLNQLHPRLSWHESGVLRYASPDWDGTFDLGGRGLELRPSFFLQDCLSAVPSRRNPTVLNYPVTPRPAEQAPPRTDGLAHLIGAPRARALRAISQGPCTTTQLAERLRVTSPSASAHATALRTAGAITTEREGRQVRHSLTQLGHDLLHSNPARHLRTAAG
ncbi:winged helix-turn-helix domain-containing protein [Kitasatospora sp. NPDC002227]|uniref:ArsR/SmtB family transcription factor n=1 Tax=Kitasatospora sp. NPDC002227 TaxID=3154773 RepID=UPI003322CB6B